MDLLKNFADLIKSPASSKPYRDLVVYYSKNKKLRESVAFSKLIEKKFDKNVDSINNNPK